MAFYSFITKHLFSKKSKPIRKSFSRLDFRNMMQELGVRTDSTLGSYNEEETPDNLTINQYIQMQENDGTVRAITRLLTMPIQAATIKIIPSIKDNGERDFIDTVFMKPQYAGGMSTPLSFVIADMTRAIFEGFRLYEKVPQIIKTGQYSGMIGWKKLAPRSSSTISLQSDEHGGFMGAHQTAYFGDKTVDVNIPKEKCILYTFQKERHPLYGESILKTAFYHYDKKHKLYYFAHKKAENDAVGVKILKLGKPFTEDEVSKAEEAVDAMRADSRITLPQGFELEINRSGSGYNVLDLINHHDTQIVLSTLTQALQLGTRQKYGYPYGKGFGQQSEYIVQSLHYIMKSMEDTLNEWAIPQLIDWNYGSGNYPKIKLIPLKEESTQYMMNIFESLIKKDPNTYMQPGFADKLTNEVAEELGLEVKIDNSNKDALKAFENGKKKVFDKMRKPAISTSDKMKSIIQTKAKRLKDSPYFLENFEKMGREYAEKLLKK